MIISGGENIYPVQVEEVLNEHPGVHDSVVGLPYQKWGQVVAAYVVKKDPAVTAAELDRHCIEHPMLARFKRPRFYSFVEQLPMTATSKKYTTSWPGRLSRILKRDCWRKSDNRDGPGRVN